VTPGIYARNGSYSIVIKENLYDVGSYCGDHDFCPPLPGGPFNVTQLSPDLEIEWSYALSNPASCIRQEDGSVSCVKDHPHGFEWRINAPAIDANGVVYGTARTASSTPSNRAAATCRPYSSAKPWAPPTRPSPSTEKAASTPRM
jgi:hypothetical protein